MLIDGLPPDSARHRRDPESQGWRPIDHLSALQLDVLQGLFQLTKAAHSEDGKYVPPQATPRPGAAVDESETPQAKARARKYMQGVLDQLIPPRR